MTPSPRYELLPPLHVQPLAYALAFRLGFRSERTWSIDFSTAERRTNASRVSRRTRAVRSHAAHTTPQERKKWEKVLEASEVAGKAAERQVRELTRQMGELRERIAAAEDHASSHGGAAAEKEKELRGRLEEAKARAAEAEERAAAKVASTPNGSSPCHDPPTLSRGAPPRGPTPSPPPGPASSPSSPRTLLRGVKPQLPLTRHRAASPHTRRAGLLWPPVIASADARSDVPCPAQDAEMTKMRLECLGREKAAARRAREESERALLAERSASEEAMQVSRGALAAPSRARDGECGK